MQTVAEEGNRVAADGYVLLGFQVVEREESVVALYRLGVVPGATLVGE